MTKDSDRTPDTSKQTETIEVDASLTRHTFFEDFQGILIGSVLVSFGIAIFTHLQYLTGGTAGVAFLVAYSTDFTFGQIFFTLNIPFYILAVARLGWIFTLKTFISVLFVSFFSDYIPNIFEFGEVNLLFGAVMGGLLIGSGLLMLFRHKSSLGGVNILSLYLQKYHDVNAGRFQMVMDVLVIICAFFVVDIWNIVYSVLAAICMNMILAINFKKGRYLASLD